MYRFSYCYVRKVCREKNAVRLNDQSVEQAPLYLAVNSEGIVHFYQIIVQAPQKHPVKVYLDRTLYGHRKREQSKPLGLLQDITD